MKLEEGWRIEPFASEPMVVAPVAMDWDERGRIFVVEDPGYPLNVEGRVGRVKLLEDSNGDGQPDRVTVFADGLVLPTGVMRWKTGVLVTDAPDVWYMEDTNGDGRADVKNKVLTGFALTNPQHTVNGLLFGLDNWIHIAHENPATAIVFKDKFGDRGTEIRFAARPEAALKERGRNIRFRPESFEIEALSGTSQFGHAFDEWGHHFTLNNTFHARHEVVPARYLKRNPDLATSSAQEDMPDYGRPARVFPIAPQQRFEMLTNVGEFTSACGLTHWPGGSLFVAEPAHNLVHRAAISPNGATFVAKRPRGDTEFLASTDPWFRPVNFYAGPDGALYLLDYYRLVVEHPEWMSPNQSQPKDLNAGNDRGRIYRLTPPGFAASKFDWPDKATSDQLAAQLSHPLAWWRRTAQRLLMDRRPQTPNLFATAASPEGRVHGLWTMEGLGRLDAETIGMALKDPVAGVRENAIQLAETRLAALSDRLLAMADDPDGRVRFQLLATLGWVDSAAARAVRDRILDKDMADRWVQVAALSASPAEAARQFARGKGNAGLYRLIGSVTGSRRQSAEIESMLARAIGTDAAQWRAAFLEGLASGLKQPVASARGRDLLFAIYSSSDKPARRAAIRLMETMGVAGAASAEKALVVATDPKQDPDVRADSIALASLVPGNRLEQFAALLDPHPPEPVQSAAARAMGRIPGEATGRELLKRWRILTAPVRMDAADALYRDPGRIAMVVAALKSGELQPWTLAFRHKRQLVMHRDPAIRDAARPLLEAAAGEREKVLAAYRDALSKPGDAARGREVFSNACGKCHKLNGQGSEVGPDLATVRNQPKQVLLEDILMPNRAISQGFEAYVVETVSSGTLDGVLGPQTATSITLRQEQGKEEVVNRKDIRNMYATNLSAMPGDMEKQVSVGQMADLLAYIQSR